MILVSGIGTCPKKCPCNLAPPARAGDHQRGIAVIIGGIRRHAVAECALYGGKVTLGGRLQKLGSGDFCVCHASPDEPLLLGVNVVGPTSNIKVR
jgi:hypothetical protein